LFTQTEFCTKRAGADDLVVDIGHREPDAAVGDETEAGHRHRHRLSALYRGST
jgi:hypothetical protein